MQKSVSSSRIEGTVAAPASKSVLQRLIAGAVLTHGTSSLHAVTVCDDSAAALRIATTLGAEIERDGRDLRIKGGLNPRQDVLDCGESGLSLRMFTPIGALCTCQLKITGQPALRRRPIDMIPEPLRRLGVKCSTVDDRLPLTLQGPLRGGEVTLDGTISSQFLTGLLMALPLVEADSRIRVLNLKSKPYIDLTLAILQKFGIHVENQAYHRFFVKGRQKYQPLELTVEGDYSGAAFLLVAGALRGRIEVTGLQQDSQQADRAILTVLQSCGARVQVESSRVLVERGDLRAFECDATDCPDLFPPLVALAAGCSGESHIRGANRLLFKESDRASALQSEFGQLGIVIKRNDDTLTVQGGKVKGGIVESHHDHRIAMALALAGLRAVDPVIISGAECVNKSYPAFFNDLKHVGGNIDG